MKKELFFLIHCKQKLHPNDYAGVLYSRIIYALLEINEDKTIEFIKNIKEENDIIEVSSHFAPLAGKFQSEKFIGAIEEVIKKFADSKWYDFLQQDVLEAKNAMDNY